MKMLNCERYTRFGSCWSQRKMVCWGHGIVRVSFFRQRWRGRSPWGAPRSLSIYGLMTHADSIKGRAPHSILGRITHTSPSSHGSHTHDVERPVGEAQHRKSAKRAFATKGRKFASLTSDFIQFPRQHEPRRARHGSPGGARAPRMPSSRQSTGTGTAARACAPDKDCKQPRRLRQGIDTPVTSATSAPRRL